jgi:hypothetical protein
MAWIPLPEAPAVGEGQEILRRRRQALSLRQVHILTQFWPWIPSPALDRRGEIHDQELQGSPNTQPSWLFVLHFVVDIALG